MGNKISLAVEKFPLSKCSLCGKPLKPGDTNARHMRPLTTFNICTVFSPLFGVEKFNLVESYLCKPTFPQNLFDAQESKSFVDL